MGSIGDLRPIAVSSSPRSRREATARRARGGVRPLDPRPSPCHGLPVRDHARRGGRRIRPGRDERARRDRPSRAGVERVHRNERDIRREPRRGERSRRGPGIRGGTADGLPARASGHRWRLRRHDDAAQPLLGLPAPGGASAAARGDRGRAPAGRLRCGARECRSAFGDLQPSRNRGEPRRRGQGLRAGSRSARCCARRACSTRCCRLAAAASSLWVVAATDGWSTSSRLSGQGGPSRRSRCGTRRLARAAPANSSSSRTGDGTVTSSIRGPAGRRTASCPRASSPPTRHVPTRCRPPSWSAGSIWPAGTAASIPTCSRSSRRTMDPNGRSSSAVTGSTGRQRLRKEDR